MTWEAELDALEDGMPLIWLTAGDGRDTEMLVTATRSRGRKWSGLGGTGRYRYVLRPRGNIVGVPAEALRRLTAAELLELDRGSC